MDRWDFPTFGYKTFKPAQLLYTTPLDLCISTRATVSLGLANC